MKVTLLGMMAILGVTVAAALVFLVYDKAGRGQCCCRELTSADRA